MGNDLKVRLLLIYQHYYVNRKQLWTRSQIWRSREKRYIGTYPRAKEGSTAQVPSETASGLWLVSPYAIRRSATIAVQTVQTRTAIITDTMNDVQPFKPCAEGSVVHWSYSISQHIGIRSQPCEKYPLSTPVSTAWFSNPSTGDNCRAYDHTTRSIFP